MTLELCHHWLCPASFWMVVLAPEGYSSITFSFIVSVSLWLRFCDWGSWKADWPRAISQKFWVSPIPNTWVLYYSWARFPGIPGKNHLPDVYYLLLNEETRLIVLSWNKNVTCDLILDKDLSLCVVELFVAQAWNIDRPMDMIIR